MQQRGRTLTLALAGMLAVLAGILAITAAWSLRELAYDRAPYPQIAGIAAYDIVALTNEARADRNLPALASDPLLTKAAQMKAEDMAANGYYAHVGPDGNGPSYWLKRAGYRYLNAGENLVIDRTSAEQAVSAWMGSQAHRENILRPQFTQIGVGIAEGRYKGEDTIFVVQVFGTPAASAPIVKTPQPAATPKPAPVTRAEPVKVEPVRLPSLTTSAVSATSTLPTPTDPLIGRVKAVVAPAASTIRVEAVPTTTISASTTAAVVSTLVSLPGWTEAVVFTDLGTSTPAGKEETGNWLTSLQARMKGWATGIQGLWR